MGRTSGYRETVESAEKIGRRSDRRPWKTGSGMPRFRTGNDDVDHNLTVLREADLYPGARLDDYTAVARWWNRQHRGRRVSARTLRQAMAVYWRVREQNVNLHADGRDLSRFHSTVRLSVTMLMSPGSLLTLERPRMRRGGARAVRGRRSRRTSRGSPSSSSPSASSEGSEPPPLCCGLGWFILGHLRRPRLVLVELGLVPFPDSSLPPRVGRGS